LVAHWEAWHTGWEQRLAANETRFLRSVAELQSAFQHRAMLMESNFRDSATAFQEVSTTLREISAAAQRESHASLDRALERLRSDFEAAVARQHSNFEAALRTAANEIQQKLSGDIESLRAQYQTMVHHDLRLIRQRANASEPQAISAASTPGQIEIDWVLFAHKFRGTEQRVRDSYARHTVHFKGCHDVADLGCGRGEFLEVARDASIGARGVDANHAMAEICRAKGLTVEETDIVTYLRALPDAALDGVFCGHVIEHLPAALLPELIRLCFAKMRPGAAIVLETPNPECLAIFATHFYLDPTHVRPVPPAQLAFYLEEAGFGGLETVRLNPAVDSMPTLAKLPSEFRNEFFGELDYSISARKPR
jgi:2-polyprenyl-3-methyl-5-hydroxy-6-metoxy-1,4-benzoquinol methylase